MYSVLTQGKYMVLALTAESGVLFFFFPGITTRGGSTVFDVS